MTLIKLVCSLLLSVAACQHALAQDYPSHPMRLIVPFSAGSSPDFAARQIAKSLGDLLGQSIVVDNRGGASGTIAAREVANARPDGYTLLLGTVSTHVTNPLLYKSLPYDPDKQFVPIGLMTNTPRLLAVRADLPPKTFAELVDYARAHPGKLNYGAAATLHVGLETFRTALGLDMVRIQYKGGGDAVTAAAAGQVDVVMDGAAVIMPFVKAGKLRALATTSSTALAIAPEVPTPVQLGAPDLQIVDWTALCVPAGTPAAVVETLQRSLREVLASRELKARVEAYGIQLFAGSADEYAGFIKSNKSKMAALVDAAGIQAQ